MSPLLRAAFLASCFTAFLASWSSPLPAQPSPAAINQAFGLPLLSPTGPLWEENVTAVAQRLRWREESRTSYGSSYRLYPNPALPVLDRKAYSLLLLAEDGKPSSFSFIFANKGDVERMVVLDPSHPPDRQHREAERQIRDYKRVVREDEAELTTRLTTLFGPPSEFRLDDGPGTQARARRWDWLGHTFLLIAPSHEYSNLRIIPTASLDSTGTERIHRADLREQLLQRIVRRENGDVVLTDIPMVNQGPKGYCVPATWERVLRYMGIPADMEILAMAGRTQVGGGTTLRDITMGASALVRRNGRRVLTETGQLTLRSIANHIDRGVPLMWTMSTVPLWNDSVNTRTQQRARVSDWDTWKRDTDAIARSARNLRADRNYAHVCMIIGYNPVTQEVAVSDSWGPDYAERWTTLAEVNALTLGETLIIQP